MEVLSPIAKPAVTSADRVLVQIQRAVVE
ncbi:MAG TPA: GntR family transcriptional regulator, partial [Idiomarina sp.]|nr:GntR family transcriptional regulator [Idiomarina sp.]